MLCGRETEGERGREGARAGIPLSRAGCVPRRDAASQPSGQTATVRLELSRMLGTVDSWFSEPNEPNTYQPRFCAASCLREHWAPGRPVCPHPSRVLLPGHTAGPTTAPQDLLRISCPPPASPPPATPSAKQLPIGVPRTEQWERLVQGVGPRGETVCRVFKNRHKTDQKLTVLNNVSDKSLCLEKSLQSSKQSL